MAVSLTDSAPWPGNLFTDKETSLVIPKHISLIQLVHFHHDCLPKLFGNDAQRDKNKYQTEVFETVLFSNAGKMANKTP